MCKSYPGCWAAVSGHASFLPCYGTQAESETSAHELRVLPHPGSWWGNRTMVDECLLVAQPKLVMSVIMKITCHLHTVQMSPNPLILKKYLSQKTPKHYCTSIISKEKTVWGLKSIQTDWKTDKTANKCGLIIIGIFWLFLKESFLCYLCEKLAYKMVGNIVLTRSTILDDKQSCLMQRGTFSTCTEIKNNQKQHKWISRCHAYGKKCKREIKKQRCFTAKRRF